LLVRNITLHCTISSACISTLPSRSISLRRQWLLLPLPLLVLPMP
jgi:hypothetical protein